MLSWQLASVALVAARGHGRPLALGQDGRAARGDDRRRRRGRLRDRGRRPCRGPLSPSGARPRRRRPDRGWRSARRLREFRLGRRSVQGGCDHDPDRRLRARGRRQRGRGRPDPPAQHRPARVRAAAERRRRRGGSEARLRQRRRARLLDRPSRLRQRQRRRSRRPRRDRARAPARRVERRRGLDATTRTGGTIRATPRLRCSAIERHLASADPASPPPVPAQRRVPTWRSCAGSTPGLPAA